jgi:RND family efflux transporter MFP subunit
MKRWLLIGICAWGSPLALAVDVPAVLQWSQRVELSTPVSGVVQAVNVEVGDRVRKGRVLLTLDPGRYRARVAASRGAVAKAAAEAAEAKRNLGRVQELYNRMVISTTELEQAQLRDARARGLLAETRARLQLEQRNLDDTVLRAPFDGVVLARQAQPGQAVAAGLRPQTLLVLARSGQMLARVMLYDNQIAGLRAGQPVAVSVGGKRYAGRVKTLGLEPMAAKDGVTYAVDVLFPVHKQLRAGTPATLSLP